MSVPGFAACVLELKDIIGGGNVWEQSNDNEPNDDNVQPRDRMLTFPAHPERNANCARHGDEAEDEPNHIEYGIKCHYFPLPYHADCLLT
jgi:hypothetical protein